MSSRVRIAPQPISSEEMPRIRPQVNDNLELARKSPYRGSGDTSYACGGSRVEPRQFWSRDKTDEARQPGPTMQEMLRMYCANNYWLTSVVTHNATMVLHPHNEDSRHNATQSFRKSLQ